jgi:hypothetical protein
MFTRGDLTDPVPDIAVDKLFATPNRAKRTVGCVANGIGHGHRRVRPARNLEMTRIGDLFIFSIDVPITANARLAFDRTTGRRFSTKAGSKFSNASFRTPTSPKFDASGLQRYDQETVKTRSRECPESVVLSWQRG